MTTDTNRRRLRALNIDEVSLVDKGANPHARVALAKHDTGGRPMTTDTDAEIDNLKRELRSLTVGARAKATTVRADSTIGPLEKRAAEIAERTGQTKEQAFAELLDTDEGASAYAAFDEARQS